MDAITAHIIRRIVAQNVDQDSEESEGEEEIEDAVVLEEIGTDSDSEESDSEDEDEDESDADDEREVQVTDLICTLRSGRVCRTWKGRSLIQ